MEKGGKREAKRTQKGGKRRHIYHPGYTSHPCICLPPSMFVGSRPGVLPRPRTPATLDRCPKQGRGWQKVTFGEGSSGSRGGLSGPPRKGQNGRFWQKGRPQRGYYRGFGRLEGF